MTSGDGVFGVNDVSEGSINHGTRGCKEEKSEEREEKCRMQHLAAACCHIMTAENRGAQWRRNEMSTTQMSAMTPAIFLR